jgi:HK97 family phage portal protein
MGWRDAVARAFGGAQQRSYPDPVIPSNGSLGTGFGSVRITNDTAMRNSAVWACLSLRAGLMSSFPIEVYTDRKGQDLLTTTPPVLISPGGKRWGIRRWMYATQVDLDRSGNTFGVVREFSNLKTDRWPRGVPAVIELAQLGDVAVRRREKDNALVYVIGGREYDEDNVWHETAYDIAGLDVGLSPVAYAAYALGGYLSAQQFALDWFTGSGMPAAHLKNVTKQLVPGEAQVVKSRYLSSVKAGDVFVTGNDWELKPMSAVTAQGEFINTMQYGVPDIARFFGCPADLIDGAVAGASITYANLSQRNLQFLITKLGPAVNGREDALSTLTSRPRFVKLDTSTLLSLDHLQQAQLDKINIDSRLRLPSEIRARDNLAPYTGADLSEFEELFGKPGAAAPVAKSAPDDTAPPATGAEA